MLSIKKTIYVIILSFIFTFILQYSFSFQIFFIPILLAPILFYILGMFQKKLYQKTENRNIWLSFIALALPIIIQLYGLKINWEGTKFISQTVIIFILIGYILGLNSAKAINFKILVTCIFAYSTGNWLIPYLYNISNTKEVAYLKKIDFGDSLFDKSKKKIDTNQLKNKILFLNFWDSNCGFCFKKIPFVEKLHKEAYNKEVIFLNINTGQYDDYETFLKFSKKFPEHPNFITVYDSLGQFSKSLNVELLPREFIINKESIIKYENEGFPDIEKKTYVSNRVRKINQLTD